jgi:hypothetical protein
MPSFATLPEEKKAAMVDFLASLKVDAEEGGRIQGDGGKEGERSEEGGGG